MKGDLNEMQHMLEDYLAFAKGDGGEEATPTHVRALLEEVVVGGPASRRADRR